MITEKKKSIVMVFGTFDILHPGHTYFFNEAKKLGDYLIAVVSRDDTVLKIKKRTTLNSENLRLENLQNSKLVDKAVLGNSIDYYKVIEDYKPDIICLGYDQKSFISIGLQDELIKRGIGIKIFHIEAYLPQVYKSSKIREELEQNSKVGNVRS